MMMRRRINPQRNSKTWVPESPIRSGLRSEYQPYGRMKKQVNDKVKKVLKMAFWGDAGGAM